MKRFDIYTHTEHTTSWGEDVVQAVLSVKPAETGKWVEYSEVEEKLRLIELKYQTMENDRDNEKHMKATARMQRDKMTTKYTELVELLEELGVLQYDEEWAIQIRELIESHKAK